MFNGRTEEALNFYQSALGANIACIMRFSESPEPPPPGTLPDGYENKVMHAAFTIGESTVMASDGCGENHPVSGISLSLAVKSAEEADKYFEALAADGEITMPLGETFWSPRFGMVKDRFGVHWMVGVVSEDCQ